VIVPICDSANPDSIASFPRWGDPSAKFPRVRAPEQIYAAAERTRRHGCQIRSPARTMRTIAALDQVLHQRQVIMDEGAYGQRALDRRGLRSRQAMLAVAESWPEVADGLGIGSQRLGEALMFVLREPRDVQELGQGRLAGQVRPVKEISGS
jgi:hypothetical protein